MPGSSLQERGSVESEESADQHGDTFHDRRIDHLASARTGSLQQSSEHAEGKEHRPTAIVPDKVQWRYWLLAKTPDRVERASEGDVVDVMPGRLGKEPGLPIPGYPAINEPGIAGVAHVRADS